MPNSKITNLRERIEEMDLQECDEMVLLTMLEKAEDWERSCESTGHEFYKEISESFITAVERLLEKGF